MKRLPVKEHDKAWRMFSPRRFEYQQAGASNSAQPAAISSLSFRLISLIGDSLESSEVSGSSFGLLLSGALEDLLSPLPFLFCLRH
jgi:hypothetical protein